MLAEIGGQDVADRVEIGADEGVLQRIEQP